MDRAGASVPGSCRSAGEGQGAARGQLTARPCTSLVSAGAWGTWRLMGAWLHGPMRQYVLLLAPGSLALPKNSLFNFFFISHPLPNKLFLGILSQVVNLL